MEKLLLGLLFNALGAFALLVASFSWLRARRLIAESAVATGEVVALNERRGRRVMYAPVVRFTSPDGRSLEFTDEISRNRPGYRVGDRVRIMYLRRDPTDVRIASRYGLYAPVFSFALFGAVFAAVGCGLLYLYVFG